MCIAVSNFYCSSCTVKFKCILCLTFSCPTLTSTSTWYTTLSPTGPLAPWIWWDGYRFVSIIWIQNIFCLRSQYKCCSCTILCEIKNKWHYFYTFSATIILTASNTAFSRKFVGRLSIWTQCNIIWTSFNNCMKLTITLKWKSVIIETVTVFVHSIIARLTLQTYAVQGSSGYGMILSLTRSTVSIPFMWTSQYTSHGAYIIIILLKHPKINFLVSPMHLPNLLLVVILGK